MPVRVLLAIGILVPGWPMSLPADAETQRPRPVVALECRAAEDALPGACRALKDALRAAAPGAVQRVMDDLAEAPARPGDMALALRVAEGRMRLDWRVGAETLRQGPSARLAPGTDPSTLIRRLLADLPAPFP